MSQIKAIIFDFGNVLDVPDDREAWLAQRDHLAAGVGMSGEELWSHLFWSDAWEQAKRGQMSDDEFWADRLLPLGLHSPEERQAFVHRLFAGRNRGHRLVRALLERLHGRYRLAVLSNSSIQNMADWVAEQCDLGGLFDHVISSADVGLVKPEEAIYRLMLERLSVAPEEALFIDDLERNTAAAEALGIETIVFMSPEALWEQLRTRGVLDGGSP